MDFIRYNSDRCGVGLILDYNDEGYRSRKIPMHHDNCWLNVNPKH
jgi:hypothetical protein